MRLLDFNVCNETIEIINSSDSESSDSDKKKSFEDNKEFIIQVFGIDEKGDSYSIYLDDYKPFFYVSVANDWKISDKDYFITHLKKMMTKYYENSLITSECKLIKRHKLYGFNDGKEYKFILLKFKNTIAMNKVKNLFYENHSDINDDGTIKTTRKLLKNGMVFKRHNHKEREHIELYEANIPPLLRFFHIKNISPSGWVKINKNKLDRHSDKITNCTYEYTTSYKNMIALNDCELTVPYKICSFDIEASSSHGDFPIAKKTYIKLATNILDYWLSENDYIQEYSKELQNDTLKMLIKFAFGFHDGEFGPHIIEKVYVKKPIKQKSTIEKIIIDILDDKISDLTINGKYKNDIEKYINSVNGDKDEDEGDDFNHVNKPFVKKNKSDIKNDNNIIDILNDSKMSRENKLIYITNILDKYLPAVKGDIVTFIGSTFIKYGDKEPYLNHCIALDTCDDVPGSTIETYKTEKQVLMAWTKLIQKENPDIIIGYNIFGFDYKFMFQRAQENGYNCLREFLKLSRNKDEICGEYKNEYDVESYKIQESSLTIASGTHDLQFIKMNGRIQIDLYNYFRRDYNLTSYKLDYVSGYFIGDGVKKIEYEEDEKNTNTLIYSKNLTGLKKGHYIHFEEIGHTTETYKENAKFKVIYVDDDKGLFKICGKETPDMSKMVRWCMAKDDVTPQDIFRLTNEGPKERAIIAKYCIQDCNLVQNLLIKIDVITGFVEMANICSVPIDFLVMRGQGIKLFSFVSKQCMEARTLIPVLEKKEDGGYEGAIVLPPKCGLYLDEPVACVDYSSLYPSSMISENLSHDSKVWTREYNLKGELIKETGEKNVDGEFIYDNLPGYKYVDVDYDTYEYRRKSSKSAAIKTKVGNKICRFAQFPNGKLAIMPRILKELLYARKTTRTTALWKDIITKDNKYTGLVIKTTDENITVKNKDGIINVISTSDIISMDDTYNDFMKNVLDKRQLAIKVTANSLYGQCGARTSSFYEKDVAASTTAIGRKLLTYGKRIIEEVYGDRICTTKYGTVKSNAEYIYGDTDSVFMSFKLTDHITGKKIVGKEALKHTIELAKEAGELATKFLKAPHDLEYEKTFMPFCLLSKKRYVGMLYENDPDKCYRKSMGIVLKRRDNAPIVKDIYGGIIDILMKDKDVSKAIKFTKKSLNDMVNEKYPMDKLIITKSLRGFYKNPLQIAHKVLATRMGKRDPGNKPSSGDRIPFVYIQTKKNVKLQGDKIETPQYILDNKLKPDYGHYITNQIMKPVQQVFALVLEDIPEYKSRVKLLKRKLKEIQIKYKDDLNKINQYEQKFRNTEVKGLIFDDSLRISTNNKNNQISIKNFLN